MDGKMWNSPLAFPTPYLSPTFSSKAIHPLKINLCEQLEPIIPDLSTHFYFYVYLDRCMDSYNVQIGVYVVLQM